MKSIYQKGIQSASSRAPLLNVCITRWVENIDGLQQFSLSHPFLVGMCEVIVYGDSEYEMYNEGWSVEDKRNTQAHLNALKSLEFIYIYLGYPTAFSSISEGSCGEITRTEPRYCVWGCPDCPVFQRNTKPERQC